MDLIGVLVLGVLAVIFTAQSFKEWLDGRRWQRMAREMERIRTESLRPAGVSVSWARGQHELRERLGGAPVREMWTPDDGLESGPASEWAGRLSAYRQELAASGRSLDDCRID